MRCGGDSAAGVGEYVHQEVPRRVAGPASAVARRSGSGRSPGSRSAPAPIADGSRQRPTERPRCSRAAPPDRATGAASASAAGSRTRRERAFGLPNLRRNVCPHFYVTGSRARPADPRSAPAQGHRPPGQRRLPLPAPRRRAPRAELRQRRLPLAALQPVRVLRGGAERPLRPRGPDAPRAYHAAVARWRRGRFGIRLGLGRTRALLRDLGHPQRSLRGALVGGTNGKGSVLALAGSALRAAGIRVGTTPKPHLVTYRERLQIDGRPIDPGDVRRLVGEASSAAERIERRHGPPPSSSC